MLSTEFSNKIKRDPQVVKSINEMMNNKEFQSYIEVLQKKKKTGLIAGLVSGGAILLLIGIISLVNQFYLGLLVAAILGLAIFLIIFLGSRHSINNAFNDRLVPSIVKSLYGPNAKYNRHGGYSSAYLTALDLFPVNELEQEDMISGEYLSVPCKIADVTSYHWEVHSNGKTTTREKVIDFEGMVMSMKMNKRSKSRLLAVEGGKFFGGKSLEFESIDFNKKFKVYGEEANGFYILTPVMQVGMTDIVDSIPGKYSFLFRDEELVIVAGGHTTTFKTDVRKPLNTNVNIVLDSILPLAYIIKTLRLDIKYKTEVNPNQPKPEEKSIVEDVAKGLTAADSSIDKETAEELLEEIEDK